MHHRPLIIETPCGSIAVGRRDGQLVVDWIVDAGAADGGPIAATGGQTLPPLDADSDADADANALASAIRAGFAGDDTALERIPTGAGTDFQRRVWNACRTIPRGETRTYGAIAQQLGGGHALCRAVGQALRRNPLPIVVPCHRVVAGNGLGGYAGDVGGKLAQIKRMLLALERTPPSAPC